VFQGGLVVPSRMVFLMWLAFALEQFLGISLKFLGIYPRTLFGTIGILTSPFIHGNLLHIISNTIPFLILGGVLFFFFERIAPYVFAYCFFYTNILVWLFARPNMHIGASGLVYGMASFLIFYGFFKKDIKSLLISAIILFFYAGMVYGILPTQPNISWESHLFGAVVGLFSAMYFGRRTKRA